MVVTQGNHSGLAPHLTRRKSTLGVDAGDDASRCGMILGGTLGEKAKGVVTDVDALKGIEASATVHGTGSGVSTHKCNNPVATCRTTTKSIANQGSWKEPMSPVPVFYAGYAIRLLIQWEGLP